MTDEMKEDDLSDSMIEEIESFWRRMEDSFKIVKEYPKGKTKKEVDLK